MNVFAALLFKAACLSLPSRLKSSRPHPSFIERLVNWRMPPHTSPQVIERLVNRILLHCRAASSPAAASHEAAASFDGMAAVGGAAVGGAAAAGGHATHSHTQNVSQGSYREAGDPHHVSRRQPQPTARFPPVIVLNMARARSEDTPAWRDGTEDQCLRDGALCDRSVGWLVAAGVCGK